jgi:hypothetical protein
MKSKSATVIKNWNWNMTTLHKKPASSLPAYRTVFDCLREKEKDKPPQSLSHYLRLREARERESEKK